jgi:hypothetical protein
MKKYICGPLIAFAIPFSFTGCATTTAHRTTWEYKVVSSGASSEKTFNDLGKEGWELVAQEGYQIFVFKRPVQK